MRTFNYNLLLYIITRKLFRITLSEALKLIFVKHLKKRHRNKRLVIE